MVDGSSHRDARLGGSGVDYTQALIAVFVAGLITGAIESLLRLSRFDPVAGLYVSTLTTILLGAVLLQLVLLMMDAGISFLAAVGTAALGSVVSLAVTMAMAPAELRAETHAGHATPTLVPIAGLGFNAIGLLAGLAVMFVQALIVQSCSR